MTYLPYGAIEAFDCERVAIVLPSSAYKEGQYPESIVVHHSAGLNATPVKFGIEYVPKEVRERLAAENGRMHELVRLLHRCAKSGGCEPCGYVDGCDITDEMRKYGIEANDG